MLHLVVFFFLRIFRHLNLKEKLFLYKRRWTRSIYWFCVFPHTKVVCPQFAYCFNSESVSNQNNSQSCFVAETRLCTWFEHSLEPNDYSLLCPLSSGKNRWLRFLVKTLSNRSSIKCVCPSSSFSSNEVCFSLLEFSFFQRSLIKLNRNVLSSSCQYWKIFQYVQSLNVRTLFVSQGLLFTGPVKSWEYGDWVVGFTVETTGLPRGMSEYLPLSLRLLYGVFVSPPLSPISHTSRKAVF